MEKKPRVKLTGTDGNVFALIGKVRKCLLKAKQEAKAKEMTDRIFKAKSYGESLGIMAEYVDIS